MRGNLNTFKKSCFVIIAIVHHCENYDCITSKSNPVPAMNRKYQGLTWMSDVNKPKESQLSSDKAPLIYKPNIRAVSDVM